MSQLAKSSAAPAIKTRAKQMLLGEDLVDTKRLATDTIVSALYKVFVEGIEDKVVEEQTQQLDEMEERKYKIRVTDKNTGNSYVRMATRAKISELRANSNISSVEMTQYGEPSKSEKEKGSSTAKAKSGKGLDPVGREDKDIDNDGDHDKTDKYLLNRRKKIGSAISTRKEDYNWKDGFAELLEKKKEEDSEKEITGKGVNNNKLIKVFPDDSNGIKEQVKPEEQVKPDQQKQQPQQNQSAVNQVLMAKQRADMAQKDLANKQRMASQKGVNLTSLSSSYEPEGDHIDEKITAKTDMGAAITDFQKSKSSQLAGRTKEERRKAAIAAVLTARRGGRKLDEENCECEDDEPKLKKSEGGVEDPREIPTKVNLAKNKLRAMGLKMSYEPEGEVIDERRKEDKVAGTPRKPRNRAFELVAKSMGAGRMGVQPRGKKKVPGQKPPTAGEYGSGVKSPAQKVAQRRAAAQRAQDNMSSRFD